jgi:hypothetical protein
MVVKGCLSIIFFLLHLFNTGLVISTLVKVFKKVADKNLLIRTLIVVLVFSFIAFIIKTDAIVGFSGVIEVDGRPQLNYPGAYMVYYVPKLETVFLAINFIGVLVALIGYSVLKNKQ